MSEKSISFQNIVKKNDTLTFQLVNAHVSYANTLRRIILSEVPSVGFRAEIQKDGTTGDVVIYSNTTAMSNEMLAHRIGLIPIHASVEGWEKNKYIFKLNKQNTTDSNMDVFVSDIEVYETRGEEEIKVPNTKFFRPDRITGDTSLLLILKAKIGNQTPEEVSFKAFASVGIGKENIRFSPVSQCSFGYTLDTNEENITKYFNEWLSRHRKVSYVELENDPVRKEKFMKEFRTMEIARCYLKNEKGEPYSFDFTVETVAEIDPIKTVISALSILQSKCHYYAAIDKGELPDNIKIQPTKKQAKGWDVYFQHEDHTLGNLLTTWMDENILDPHQLKEGTIGFCGYCIPHPLRDEMLMTIISKDILICRKAIATSASQSSKMFGTWREVFISQSS